MRNPLYHWTHLELKTAFGVEKLLSPATAREIYDHCSAMLQQPERSARGLMMHYNVEAVCTTDDPVDTLEHHIKAKKKTDLRSRCSLHGAQTRRWPLRILLTTKPTYISLQKRQTWKSTDLQTL